MLGLIKFFALDIVLRYWWTTKLWFSQSRRRRNLLLQEETELVIEGFPRCANSFAVVAFETVQSRRVYIAHHLHSEGQVLEAVRRQVPTMVVYREPIGAVTSLVIRDPSIRVGQGIRRYINFYERVLAVHEKVVLADFRDVTADYASVIERLNQRFHRDFRPYFNSTSHDQAVFTRLDELNESDSGGDLKMVARPLTAKANVIASKRVSVAEHPLMQDATKIFKQLEAINSKESLAASPRIESELLR